MGDHVVAVEDALQEGHTLVAVGDGHPHLVAEGLVEQPRAGRAEVPRQAAGDDHLIALHGP